MLTSITDYKSTAYRLQLDDDAGPTSFFNTDTNALSTNYSEELRIYDASDKTRLTAGLYYLHIRAALDPDRESLPAFGVYYDSPATLRTNSFSGFAQVEQDLTDQLTLVAGVRVVSERKEFEYASNLFANDGASLGPARSSYAGSSNDTLVPGKLQLEYRPFQDFLFYGGYNRGAKAGNFNAPFAGGTSFPDSQIPYKPRR